MIGNWVVYVIITESYLAAVVYLAQGDWKHGLYWALAGSLNLIVTVLR